MENTISINLSKNITFEANPQELIDHVVRLKARIHAMEYEVSQHEENMLALVKSRGGKITSEFDDFKADVTLCRKNTYKFSKEINDLEIKKQALEIKIKAKKMVEITCGAEIKSESLHLRYNLKMSDK